MVRSQDAASLVVALADLVREGEADLVEVDQEDLRVVLDALAAWLADPRRAAAMEPAPQGVAE